MENNLTMLEEFDIERRLKFPHLLYAKSSSLTKRKIAYIIKTKTNEELLLINSSGFGEPCVVAGLTEKHIEYFAKNASLEHKQNIFKLLVSQSIFEEVLDIVKEMDEDAGNGITINKDRFKRVLRYIQDNWIVFHS